MKNLILLSIIAMLGLSAKAQITSINTNGVDSGLFQWTVGTVNITNIVAVVVPEYAPDLIDSAGHRSYWGVEIAALYPVSPHIFTGAWIDYFGNNVTLGTVGVTLQTDLKLFNGHVVLHPFFGTGAGETLNDAGKVGGNVIGQVETGVAFTLWKWKNVDLGLALGYKRTTKYDANIYQIAPLLNFHW